MSSAVDKQTMGDSSLSSHDNSITAYKRPKIELGIATSSNVDWQNSGTSDSEPTSSTNDVANHSHYQHSILHPGRWIKDKCTHTTHEEREIDQVTKADRVRHARGAMEIAMVTGETQLVGKDANGQDIYVEPLSRAQYNSCKYSPYGYGGYGYGGYGYGGCGYGYGFGLDALLLGGHFFW